MLGHGEAHDSDELGKVSTPPVWRCGEPETGTVRAHNIRNSTLSNLHKPGNTSYSSRYFANNTKKRGLGAQSSRMSALQGNRSGMTLDRAFPKTVTVSSEQLNA